MRSLLPTHVPPNLCTSNPELRSTPPAPGEGAAAGAGSISTLRATVRGVAGARGARLGASLSARAREPVNGDRRAAAAAGAVAIAEAIVVRRAVSRFFFAGLGVESDFTRSPGTPLRGAFERRRRAMSRKCDRERERG
tara:strand:+ start:2263 stop:2676 length:414 start_codon:yes stop_codon:yes gene_type:complete